MFTVRRWWDRYWLQLVLASLILGSAWFLRQTQGTSIAEIYYWAVSPFQSEQKLEREAKLTNARVKELEQRLADLENQNAQLQKLLGYYKAQKQPVITAPVIGRSADNWWQQIILGRGSKDGIKKEYVVTSIGGLVGRVIEVTPNTSRVLLISDPTSRIGATVSRSRRLGVIKGQGSQIAVMQFFEKVPDVKPGDVITTSGVSRLFPGGLPIGKVKSVTEDTKSPAPKATIELTAPLNYVEWAIVHPFTTK